MTRFTLLLIILLISGCKSSSLPSPTEAAKKLGPNPYYELDELPVDRRDFYNIDAESIARVTQYVGTNATEKFGEKAKDGAVLVYTKLFATNKYETFFKSVSREYEAMLAQTAREDIQYILNDQVLTEHFEGTLALIDSKLLKKIRLIDQNQLTEKFQVQGKKVGVLVESRRPKNLYNSKKNF